MMKPALIIFVRNPVLGKVKTRLAATTGDERALSIYQNLLKHTFEISKGGDADKFVFYFNDIEKDDLWSAEGFYKRLQSGDDLGDKMKNAFQQVFAEGYGKTIIMGSDCFELTTGIINEAFRLLDKNDVVIGPARDGGYYLLGLKKPLPFIFENKAWSTSTVYNETINDLKAYNLSFAVMPVLRDIDTEEDLPAVKKINS